RFSSVTSSSLSSTSRKASWGTYLPSTPRHTVSGVARRRPTGPQSQVQKAMAISNATCETPALRPPQNHPRLLPADLQHQLRGLLIHKRPGVVHPPCKRINPRRL